MVMSSAQERFPSTGIKVLLPHLPDFLTEVPGVQQCRSVLSWPSSEADMSTYRKKGKDRLVR